MSGLALEPGSDYLAGETAQQLAVALSEVLDQPADAARLGQAGREYVRVHHDWAVAASQVEAIYEDLARQPVSEASCA